MIEVVLGTETDPPMKVLIASSDFDESYDVPKNESGLSSLAWVISIHAEEQIFSYSRADLGDVVRLT